MPYPFGFQYDSTGEKCTAGPQVGASNLARWAKKKWALPLIGIFNCRPARGSTSLSTHGEGRGIDLHVHTRASEAPPTASEKVLGDIIAKHFVTVAHLLGVQRVIWLDREWNSRTKQWRNYTGPYHGNHIHVELCWAAARELTTDNLDQASQGDDEMTPAQLAEIKAHIDGRVNQVANDLATTFGKRFNAIDAKLEQIDQQIS